MHELVVEEFRKYYRSMDTPLLALKEFQQRELAFLQFGEQMMIRHMAFRDEEELKEYLAYKTPAHVYYSSAYYSNPMDQNMNRKGWLGADLVFDIDADHIPTPCKSDHDIWLCLDCKSEGRGFPPESCPNCGKKRLDTRTWVCERCLGTAKDEIFKLMDEYLIPDFGLTLGDIEICFSGHRGYHLHIASKSVRELSNDGRREIADYVRGIGIDFELQGFKALGKREPLIGPNIHDKGWRGRVARALYSYLNRCDPKELAQVLDSKRVADNICRDKDKILRDIAESPSWWGGLSKEAVERFNRVAAVAVKEIVCNIDERVTIDIKRLIRYPNSLHGKSGLVARSLSYADLEYFDPLRDAVAFKGGTIKVYVKDVPRIRLGEEEIGPLKGAVVEVPKAIGIYLLCRGAAEPR
jgi:DNA primase small subunit